MISIPEFDIKEVLFSGGGKMICHAVRQEDGQAVILKVVSGAMQHETEAVKLRREYELVSKLAFPGVPKILGIKEFGEGVAIVMEDFGGLPLKTLIPENGMPLKQFFPIAGRLADIVAALHRQQIIHKDIKPDNILLNTQTGEVRLIDFGIAVLISQETVGIVSHQDLEGSLQYLSPEQTGRMNRPVDYRTDFYSLGVSFYQMLTGRLPFTSDDPAELVHAHLARNPRPPAEINPAIPPVLQSIVLKLMDKSPERRYQSAGGLKKDLDTCAQRLDAEGNIPGFEIGASDFSGRFHISHKLYGRELELRFLLDSFDDTGQGKAELLLVSGFSGIGKSSLIREIHKPVVSRRAYFTEGKFDQFNRDAPYSAVILAFRSLLGQLLSESDARVTQWKSDLLDALGPNGQVIIDVIPEVQLIIGAQPEVVTLPPSEAQNRFNLVFQKFVQALATADHPLVLFLDDLQWADTPSLKLMELLLLDKETSYFLVIGAYRDNEVDATHPLMKTIQVLKEAEDTVREITLKPLEVSELNQLVADTLHCPPARAEVLGTLLEQKTGGNPFFVNEFLKSLHADGLIVFDFGSNTWVWDIEKIYGRNITDNVVELMRGKILLLDSQTQRLCQYAACIGNKFDLHTLATVWEKSTQSTARTLGPAIAEGLIVPVGNAYRLAEISTKSDQAINSEYRFLHDQVQNAAYILMDDDSKKALHLKIGRQLSDSFSEEEKRERIFELVTHYNLGSSLITEEQEKIQVVELNLFAGKKAKNAAAYQPAFRYMSAGLDLLPQHSWQNHYALSLELCNEAAEAAYLSGRVDEMERLTAEVFDKASELLHRVKAYTVKIQGYISLTRNAEALRTSLEILSLLGARFPENPNKLHILKSLIGTKLRLRGKSADQLVAMPDMTEPRVSAIMELMPYAASASYFAKQNLFPLIVFKQVSLSVRYGNHLQSAFAYATYGLVMCGSTQEFDEGLKYGEIAVRLLEKFRNISIYSKVHYLNSSFIQPWRLPFGSTMEGLMAAYQKGLETGDFLFSSYAIFNAYSTYYYMGRPLAELKSEMDAYAATLLKIKQNTGLTWLNIPRQAVSNLMDDTVVNSRLRGPYYDETVQKELHLNGKDYSGLCVYYMTCMVLEYYFDNTPEALESGEQCFAIIDSVLATPHVHQIYFYYALTLIRAAESAPAAQRKKHLGQARKLLKTIRKFAKSGPENFLSKQYLVEAELGRLHGDISNTRHLYDLAIKTAKENNFINDEALANELAARFQEEKHQRDQSKKYLLEARRLYQKWGAMAKVNWLDHKYGLKDTSVRTGIDATISRSGTQSNIEMDMHSLMKAALAISGEIQLDKIMSRLMHVMVENAGAQNGFCLIEREGNWLIEARGSVDSADEKSWVKAPLKGNRHIPETVTQYVVRTREDLVLHDIQVDGRFSADPVVKEKKLHSVLCLPVLHQGNLIGMLYAENNLNSGVFTEQRVQFLKLLSGQVAVSLENALQYEQLEQKIAERTAEVMQQKEALEKSLSDLKMAQAKLVDSEKMASLGQLTAGLAHEINNPINFVSVGVNNLRQNFDEFKSALEVYLALDPEADNRAALQNIVDKKLHRRIAETVEDSDEMFRSIQNGINRTVSIVKSLRNFSRLDEGEIKTVDLHEGLDSTLEILQSQIRKKADIHKDYGELPMVECAAGKVNQVFLNIINNALQAMEDQGVITLTTRFLSEQNEVAVSIADTGSGMSEAVRRRLFEPFFTTKPVGEGTGLGLSISYGIIEDHKGRIEVESEEGKGSVFTIYLPVNQ